MKTLHLIRRRIMFKWIKRFNEGCESCKDNVRLGRPFTLYNDKKIELVQSCVFFDRWMTVQMIADELNMRKWFVHTILTQELQLKKLYVKWRRVNIPPWKCCCSFVCANSLVLGSKFYHDALHLFFSSDLTQCNLFFFLKFKMVIRGQHWDDLDNIKHKTTRRRKTKGFNFSELGGIF